jgi:hypothetical protein
MNPKFKAKQALKAWTGLYNPRFSFLLAAQYLGVTIRVQNWGYLQHITTIPGV